MNDLPSAKSHLQSALSIFREIDSRLGEANALRSLGDLAVRMDDLPSAKSHLQSALSIFREIDEKLGEASVLRALDILASHTDDSKRN
jgi:uncharacterized protein HemY